MKWDLFLVVWWAHSGCRWLRRSLLARNRHLATSEFVVPFLTVSTDMILNLDRTAQIHKARSLVELTEEFEALRHAVEAARRHGLEIYFQDKKRIMTREHPGKKHGGVMSLGAPEPCYPDLALLCDVLPSVRIVHLVRHPKDCFLSMRSRAEMDGAPCKIGASWSGINALVRQTGTALKTQNRYFMLRYEDLTRQTEVELRRLCDWIGVPFDEDMLKGVDEYHGKNRDVDLAATTKPDELCALKDVVQTEAQHYGYEC